MNPYHRRAIAFNNEMRRSCGALLGIVQGLLSDSHLSDQEIKFLRDWLANNEAVAHVWPGDVILAKIEDALADGAIQDNERQHLAGVLQQLVGGTLDELAESTHVTQLALDQVDLIDFSEKRFCLTGEFVFGPRTTCEGAIERRGGLVQAGITKKLHYVVVGGLGSPEWKHGSFGSKIEKAIEYKRDGLPILIVHEDVWAASLKG